MTKDELKLALKHAKRDERHLSNAETRYWCDQYKLLATQAIEALAQPEPVKIAHKHEWFRTGEMKIGQMRCISCGTWGQEETPQRTWVGLTEKDICEAAVKSQEGISPRDDTLRFAIAIEAKLKEKNT